MPLNSSDYHLLIISDLHLSEGRDERTHRLSRNEDFLFDEEFARFLDYHVKTDPARKWHLIINGDFCDFLQVISSNFDEEFLAYLKVSTEAEGRKLLEIARQDTKYGFDAGPGETVLKLWKVLNGHWMFTCALIKFIEAGNLVSIGSGNHDAEWAYPLVREHFHRMLGWFYGEKKCGSADAGKFHEICCAGVQFLDWFYYEPEVIWAEHGGQYDVENCFPHWLAPFLPKSDHIEMPWGSFFVRYFFNSVEQQEPFADNIKPQSAFISWLIIHHPLLALQFLYGNGRHMLKKMRRAWTISTGNDPRAAEHLKKRQELEQQWKVPAGVLADIDAHQADSVFREPKGIWKVWKALTWAWPVSLSVVTIMLAAGVVGVVSILNHIAAPIAPAALKAWRADLVVKVAGAGAHDVYAFFQWIAFVYLVLGGLCALVVIGDWIYRLNKPKGSETCYLIADAEFARSKLNVQFVTMGHTHDTDLASLQEGAEYFNTGTWTKVFSPEEELTRDESELVFLQGLRGPAGLSCRLMKWEDGAGEPRLVKLFSDITAPGHPKKSRSANPQAQRPKGRARGTGA